MSVLRMLRLFFEPLRVDNLQDFLAGQPTSSRTDVQSGLTGGCLRRTPSAQPKHAAQTAQPANQNVLPST